MTGSGLAFQRIRRLLCCEWTVGGLGPLGSSFCIEGIFYLFQKHLCEAFYVMDVVMPFTNNNSFNPQRPREVKPRSHSREMQMLSGHQKKKGVDDAKNFSVISTGRICHLSTCGRL